MCLIGGPNTRREQLALAVTRLWQPAEFREGEASVKPKSDFQRAADSPDSY